MMLIVGSAMLFVIGFSPAWVALVTGLIVGHYATPDVRDQHQKRNYGEHMVSRHYGCFAGWIWTAIWWLPAKIIPHRRWGSHLPIVATAIAALWLYWLPWLILRSYGVDVPVDLMLWHLAGWSVQDFVHLAQDGWRVNW